MRHPLEKGIYFNILYFFPLEQVTRKQFPVLVFLSVTLDSNFSFFFLSDYLGNLPNLARYQDWIGFFEKLKDPSINVNEVCLDTRATALHYAAKYGQAQICQDLINRGAIVEARDFRGHTPLHACAAFSSPESVATAHVLIQNGANPETLDDRGNTSYAVCQRINVGLIDV